MPKPLQYALYALNYSLGALMLYWLVVTKIRAMRGRPRIAKAEIVYQEWWASGCSQRYWWTKMGGARNCLRLVVTPQILWVTSWFPFSLITPFYDMEQVIPLGSITSVRELHKWYGTSLLLAYTDTGGNRHELRLAPRKKEEFLRSIGGLRDVPGDMNRL